MTLYEIVAKLAGPIQPVGETREDTERLANLGHITDLVDELVRDLHKAAVAKNRPESSMRAIGKLAAQALGDLGIEP